MLFSWLFFLKVFSNKPMMQVNAPNRGASIAWVGYPGPLPESRGCHLRPQAVPPEAGPPPLQSPHTQGRRDEGARTSFPSLAAPDLIQHQRDPSLCGRCPHSRSPAFCLSASFEDLVCSCTCTCVCLHYSHPRWPPLPPCPRASPRGTPRRRASARQPPPPARRPGLPPPPGGGMPEVWSRFPIGGRSPAWGHTRTLIHAPELGCFHG